MGGPTKRTAGPVIQDEEAFPRGGGSGLAPIAHKKLRQEAYAEAEADLFGSRAKGEKGSKKRRKSQLEDDVEGDEEDIFFQSMTVQGKVPKYAGLLKYKNVDVGTKLWGAIIEVTPNNLIVSLPHGLKGYVEYSEASDVLADAVHSSASKGSKASQSTKDAIASTPLHHIFSIGQLVRCTVLSKSAETTTPAKSDSKSPKKDQKQGGGKRINVSLRLSKLCSGLSADAVRAGAHLPATVKSEEDHGYVLSFGIKGVSGFLPKKGCPYSALRPGSSLEVLVKSSKTGGAAVVTVAPSEVHSAVTTESEGLNLDALLPGSLVTARVRNVLSDGLLLSFLTFFSGTVDPFHLGGKGGPDWKRQYGTDHRVKARILYVDSESKRVGLTMLRHLVEGHAPENFPMMGQIFETARVMRVDNEIGVLVSLPAVEDGGPELTPGYAHISNLSDTRIANDEIEKRFRVGQAVKARVIGFRPMDGLAAVSLRPSVVNESILSIADVAPGVKVDAEVLKSDENGLVVRISPTLRAFVPTLHISDLASTKTHKKFQVGKKVAGRVLEVDQINKKITVTLKPALVDSKFPPIGTLAAAVPGARTHGTIVSIQDYGVFVAIYGGLSGLAHLKECGLAEGQNLKEAFTVGQVVKIRILGSDPSKKGGGLRLSLVSKKKGADTAKEAASLSALAALQLGSFVSGTVTGIHKKDDVVQYFELDVVPVSSSSKKTKKKNKSEGSGGEKDDEKNAAKGRLEVAHLADHPAAAKALSEVLQEGSKLENLLVLQKLETIGQVRLTRKTSLCTAASEEVLPAKLDQVSEGLILNGYVASITGDAIFVRFLDDLTGRAGLAQLADTFVADPHTLFTLGQSVRAQVVQLDSAKGRFTLTLKQSVCGLTDGLFLKSLFEDKEACHALDSEADASIDWNAFAPGNVVKGEVHDIKDYGTVCDLEANPDIVALAAPHQSTPDSKPGTSINGIVLDANKKDGIIDLSLLSRLVVELASEGAAPDSGEKGGKKSAQKKKKQKSSSAAAEEGKMVHVDQTIEGTVELLKADEGYAVVSLPSGYSPAIGYVSLCDYNVALGTPAATAVGSALQPAGTTKVDFKVVYTPSESGSGRLILSLPRESAAMPALGGSTKRTATAASGDEDGQQNKKGAPSRGTIVSGTVTAVHPVYAEVQLESGHRGRLHVTEILDNVESTNNAASQQESPLASLSVDSTIEVVVLGKINGTEGRKHGILELCSRPSVITKAKESPGEKLPFELKWKDIKKSQRLLGYVQEVTEEHIWVMFTPSLRGRVFIPQAVTSLQQCATVRKAFPAGKPLNVAVLSVDAGKHALDLSLSISEVDAANTYQPGSTALGMLVTVSGSGLKVKLGPTASGRVSVCDIHDTPVENAIQGLKTGQFVQVGIIEKTPTPAAGKNNQNKKQTSQTNQQLELSLKPSQGGECVAHTSTKPVENAPVLLAAGTSVKDLKPGQKVSGYVKSAGTSGVFICLSPSLDARIKLRQLSVSFVDDPAKDFPEGKLVVASVMSIENDRIDATLRQGRTLYNLQSLTEGQVVKGRVKRLERFGVFVELNDSGITGLAHLSELADDFVKDPNALFNVGQPVVARVLKIEQEANRLSLGLKPSYFEDLSDDDAGDDDNNDGDDGSEPDFDDELQQAMAGGSQDDDSEENDDDDDDAMEVDNDGDFDLDEVLVEMEEDESDDDSE